MPRSMPRSVWTVIKLLATSRKVWVAIIGAGSAIFLYAKGVIGADKLASALVALATAVIVSIAAEDSAASIGGDRADVRVAEAQARAAEAEDFDPHCCVCDAPAGYVAEGPRWYCEEHRPWDAIGVTVSHV